MRISDWSSDVCSSDLNKTANDRRYAVFFTAQQSAEDKTRDGLTDAYFVALYRWLDGGGYADVAGYLTRYEVPDAINPATNCVTAPRTTSTDRSEEHTSELQYLITTRKPASC